MKNFINVTRLNNGAATSFLVALHAIGTIKPHFFGTSAGSLLTLSFGSNGKEEHVLNEDYATVLKLIEDAQEGNPTLAYDQQ